MAVLLLVDVRQSMIDFGVVNTLNQHLYSNTTQCLISVCKQCPHSDVGHNYWYAICML